MALACVEFRALLFFKTRSLEERENDREREQESSSFPRAVYTSHASRVASLLCPAFSFFPSTVVFVCQVSLLCAVCVFSVAFVVGVGGEEKVE